MKRSAYLLRIILPTLFYIVCFSAFLPAQPWTQVSTFGGALSESLDRVSVQADGSLIVAGTYQEGMNWMGATLPNQGSSDLILARVLPDGQPDWVLYGGSSSADESAALSLDSEGNIYWAGIFWETGTWSSGLSLSVPTGGRSLFVLRCSPSGMPTWSLAIGGNGPRGVSAVEATSEGHVLVSGYFEGSLFLPGQTLQAQGTRDLFLACFDPDNGLEWALQAGGVGSAEASSMALTSDGSIAVGGFFDDVVQAGPESIVAETDDWDGLLLLVSSEGEPLWLRKIGAQYDDRVRQLAVTANGNIVAGGTFLGVLDAGQLSVSTPGFNSNAFLSAWSPGGEALWLRSLGQQANEQSLALAALGNSVVLSVLYGNNLQVDGLQLSGTSTGLSSGLVGFGPNGTASWAAGIPADDLLQLTGIGIGPNEEIWTCGSFIGSISPAGQSAVASVAFDMVLARIDDAIVSARGVTPAPNWVVFPNPASDVLFLQAPESAVKAELWDLSGKRCWQGVYPAGGLPVGHLPAGLYRLLLWDEAGRLQTIGVALQK